MSKSNFSLDLIKFANLSEKKIVLVVKKTFIELSADIINGTPVDSGRARGNWQPAINKFADTNSLDIEKSKFGTKTIAKVINKANEFQIGDYLTLTNNLDYIERLEDGYSHKAPTGMVGLNVERFSNMVDKHAKDIKRKTI